MTIEVSHPRYKCFYLLPNVFTTFTLSAGFFSILMSIKGNFITAALAIFVAFFADGFDGFTARLTNSQSKFGAEYDSFSDLIAFGIAPALLSYLWIIFSLGNFSWLIALFYIVSTALRLARFNVQLSKNEKNFFSGLPSPIAAGMLSSTVFLCEHYRIPIEHYSVFFTSLLFGLSCLMISTIRFYSIKTINSRLKWILFGLTLVIVIVLTFNSHPEGFFLLFLAYLFSCFFIYLEKLRTYFD